MAATPETLLGESDPPVFLIERAEGRSPFLLVCDHAGRAIPAKLSRLGLSEEVLSTHVASDLGAADLARRLSTRLDAFLILHGYSRLVIDANRPPEAHDSIATVSERVRITANERLSPGAVRQRCDELFRPYHRRIAEEIDARSARARGCLLVALHTFTPVYMDEVRPWHVGVLYGRDARLARLVMEELRRDRALVVGDNEPYSLSDVSDYTIPVHGERRDLPHVELEVRQDLLSTASAVRDWAELLAKVLERALARFAAT